MSRIIAIANQKGGVGKTTTAMNIAAGLQKAGKKVLLVDLDPQSSLSQYLGFEGDDKPKISDLMSEASHGNEIDIRNSIRTNAEGLDYIPANIDLSSAEFFLIQAMDREHVLKWVLNRKQLAKYDYILIDCLPSLGILLVNALAASDSVIIPVQAQKFALNGLQSLMNVYKMVHTRINPQLTIDGVLVTMLDNTRMAHEVDQALVDMFKEKLFISRISKSVQATESTNDMVSLVAMRNCKLGKEYEQVAAELITRS